MEQLLNDFSPGLFIMQAFIFLVLIILMRIFAWKPILESLASREEDIENAIEAAKKAKEEMASLTASNEKLLLEGKAERETLFAEAQKTAKQIVADASAKAQEEGAAQLAKAQAAIASEKNAAIAGLKAEAVNLSLEIAEKLLKKELSDKNAQEALIAEYLKDTNLAAN